MKILFVSQYFPPEMGAPAARVHELSREWALARHDVTVLTGFPNHPTGVVPEAYRRALRRGTVREGIDAIDVVRTWLYAVPHRRPRERILNYLSFFASAVGRGVWLGRPDVVIGTSPQLLVGLAGWVLARRFGRPFVFEVRDLWPESLPASGVSRVGSPLYRLLSAIARFLYRRADLVLAVTPAFRTGILTEAPGARIEVIENGVDTELFQPASARDAKEQIGLRDRFVVSYIGTIGFAHGLDVVLRTATLLRSRLPDLIFLLVGEGAEREKLEAKASALGLDNVRFAGQRPRTEMPTYIAASDGCLVPLRGSALFETVLPSKMLEFMACSRPVILGVRGYAQALIEKAHGGICVPPEDDNALAKAILQLYEDRAMGPKLGENGRRFVLENFSRATKAREYLAILEDLVNRRRGYRALVP